MNTIHQLKNDDLIVSINSTGAELCGIQKLPEGKDYMWNADPEIWAGYAPVLFPIIGALKGDTYFFNNREFHLPRHGFVRHNKNMVLVDSAADSLTFKLFSDKETLAIYPFNFEFDIRFSIQGNRLTINHKVVNTGNASMYFSLGAHPAFKCPIDANEEYTDYYLEFSENETAYTYHIEDSGLIGGETDLVLENSNIIDLHYRLFDKGALVFKNLKSRKVVLVSRKSGKRIQVSFDGFPYLGIWAKPDADYVCIEPWLGIADPVDTDQQLVNKEGIVKLESGKSFEAAYQIKVY